MMSGVFCSIFCIMFFPVVSSNTCSNNATSNERGVGAGEFAVYDAAAVAEASASGFVLFLFSINSLFIHLSMLIDILLKDK